MMLGLEQFEAIRELGDETGAPVVGALPAGIVFTERAIGSLRAYLDARELKNYRIFYCSDFGFYDIAEHLRALDPQASWDALPAMANGGEPCVTVLSEQNQHEHEAGRPDLRRQQVVLARWYWVDAENHVALRQFWLCAAPSPAHCTRLREEISRLRAGRQQSYWQIVRGHPDADGARVPRVGEGMDEMILVPALRERVVTEILPFFTAPIAELYRTLNVPHRRGVLLHGPPGNGKTSLIRLIGARLPQVGAMLLRPDATFDSDDLQLVIDRWKKTAPAMLVIEDLNWLLKQVNVSTFLNLIDGLETSTTGGLLLIATTNYPEQLDWAINNRPGRFDVVIEMPCPDDAIRRQFFERKLPAAGADALNSAVAKTDGLSFSHLQEILRASGFRAINSGRSTRTDEDLLHAVQVVRAAFDSAVRGFTTNPRPFGFVPPARVE